MAGRAVNRSDLPKESPTRPLDAAHAGSIERWMVKNMASEAARVRNRKETLLESRKKEEIVRNR